MHLADFLLCGDFSQRGSSKREAGIKNPGEPLFGKAVPRGRFYVRFAFDLCREMRSALVPHGVGQLTVDDDDGVCVQL